MSVASVKITCFRAPWRQTHDVDRDAGRRLRPSVKYMRRNLTLRLVMSYIYIYIYIYIYMEHLFLMFLDHTQRRSTFGRTPLDK